MDRFGSCPSPIYLLSLLAKLGVSQGEAVKTSVRSAAKKPLTGSRRRSVCPGTGRWAADGKGSFLSEKHTRSALRHNPTSLACVAQRQTGASFTDPPSSEELKSR